jgi:hypothetical protein
MTLKVQDDPAKRSEAVEELGFRFLSEGTIALVHYTDNFAASGECDAWKRPRVPGQKSFLILMLRVGEEPTRDARS